MSKFKNRIKFYLIGFGFGLVFMFFIFGNRACSWLPENRVKNMLAEKEILVGDSVADLMLCLGVTNDDVYRLLNDGGDVDFGKSKTNIEPKEYHLYGKKDNEDLIINYALYDNHTEVIGFEFLHNNCETGYSNGNKRIVPVPNFEVISIIESQEMRILEKAKCQMKCLEIKKSTIETFHRFAQVIMDKSAPRGKPNPHYLLEGKLGGRSLKIKYVIGENRTRISGISSTNLNCNCD